MKNTSQKLWLFLAAFGLILLGSSFIFSNTEPTTFVVVDDIHSMINGGGNDEDEGVGATARKRLPEKIKVPTPTVTFKGRTVGLSDSVRVTIRRVMPTGAPGSIIAQGLKKIQHNATEGYQFSLNVTPLPLDVWFYLELTFRHKNGQLVSQKGQIMRVTNN